MSNLDFDSIGVLSYIIKKCAALGLEINFTKAQKLLYCCYGAVLGRFGIRLCKEHPRAWQYGPAFPRAYSAHRKNRVDFDRADPVTGDKCPAEVRALIDETISYFGRYTASALTNWTHSPGSPWSLCSNDGDSLYGCISDEIIKSYFQNRVLKPQV